MAPAALAALTYAGSAAATTCVLPGGYVGYNNNNGTPQCLPNLEIKKTGPATVGPGVITWTVTVYHRGYPAAADPYGTDAGIPLDAIQVDDLNVGLYDITPNNPPADGHLRPGQSLTYTVRQTFDPERCFKTSIQNTARLTLNGIQQTTTSDDTYTAWADVDCTADVAIAKTADMATYKVGETVKWTVTVTNTGERDVPLSRVKVDDPAATLTPNDTTPGAVLKPGQSTTFSGTTAVTVENCGVISNTATVSLDGNGPADGNPQNNTATATATCTPPTPNENTGGSTGTPGTGSGALPGGSSGTPTNVCPKVTVGLAISAAKRPFAGQLSTVVLRVKARNNAKKVKLTYRLPAGFAAVAKTPGTTLRSGILVANLGTLKAGTTRSVRVSVRIVRTAKGSRQHTASVTATCASTARSALAANVRPLQGSINPAVTG
ncbi:MAG: hypothetical protein IT200_12075 [Thermoleophilia bacterium]|nr:hypothetical protein [Thermoleophilia bacterium]